MGVAQSIDVEQLLIWAYRDECVGYGKDSFFVEGGGWANPVYGLEALGTRVQGSSGAGRGTFPEDALTVDAAVSSLPGSQRRLVEIHANNATRPDWSYRRPEAFPVDALGHRKAKARHMFRAMDVRKTRPIACYVGYSGDSHESLRRKWAGWLDWWLALEAVDGLLRGGRFRLRDWELAEFSLPQYPWEDDPSVPHWLWKQIYLTWEMKLDTVPEHLNHARKTGR